MSEKSEPTAESTALRQERDMLLQFFHVSPVAQFVKDRSGRYVMVNARFARSLQQEPQQIAGKTDDDLFTAEIAESLRANDRQVLTASAAVEFEEVAMLPDGRHVYHSIKFPIVDAQGQIIAIGGMSIDITNHVAKE
jgi:PAS domain S-box-containing protein